MNIIVKYFVFFIAFLVALIFIFFRIRNFNLKNNKKSNLFLFYLSLILSLNNCAKSQNNNIIENNFNISNMQNDKINKLKITDEWKNFKYFWQTLDTMNQVVTFNYTKNDSSDIYFKELEIHKKSLEKINILSKDEIDFLTIIVGERIDYLFNNNFSMLVSHIAPPKILTDKTASISDFESKIDILIELQKNELIDKVEFNKSLENIYYDVYNFMIMNTITIYFPERYYVPYSESTPENNLNNLDTLYQKVRNSKEDKIEVDKKYEEAKQKIADLQTNLPFYKELINELVVRKELIFKND